MAGLQMRSTFVLSASLLVFVVPLGSASADTTNLTGGSFNPRFVGIGFATAALSGNAHRPRPTPARRSA